ncbi:alpha-1:6-mannosyl-glycoprotein 2-beta-N-acetylglucosaminyltransferase-like protein, partial [Leptotrombidium deliense]
MMFCKPLNSTRLLLLGIFLYAWLMSWLFNNIFKDSIELNKQEFFGDIRDFGKGNDLQILVNKINEKEEIFNENLFGPLKAEDAIIAIQVHNRSDYLNLTIDALRKVEGIEKTLIIFSHSIIDRTINEIVGNVKFAKVLQIFYPYSTQIFPNSFPGDDPNDCPRDATRQEAISIRCNSAEFPDKYGHYRESRFVQIRHH